MSSSQKGTPFKRKDIVKAFFNLDLSDEPSTASKTLKLHNHNCLIAFKPSAIDEVKENNKVTLLTLSVEIQLWIYNLLLISWFNQTENPLWAVKHTDQKLVLLHMSQFWQYRTMKPEILQTCKQIYHEANSILYLQNIFAISEPEQIFWLIVQIGLANFKLIKTLHIWVSWMAELSSWLQLLYILAEKASELQCIELA